MNILVCNVGSTSLKSKLFVFGAEGEAAPSGEANIDRINSNEISTFSYRVGNGEKQKKQLEISGLKNGIEFLLRWYSENEIFSYSLGIDAIGFKCVMGKTNGANLLTPAIIDEMGKYGFVAPAHNLPYIEAIEIFKSVIDVPLVGVFEPSFHYSLPDYKRYLGIPWEWHSLGIKKLGFHGASHRYLGAAANKMFGLKNGKIITLHLGGSSSICAIRNGLSVDINQQFSPNSGLLQGKRVGDTDVTSVLFAMNELGISVVEAQDMLSFGSGLKSMAGLGTEDCKTIEEAAKNGNERAQMALDLYIDGIRKDIGGFATVLGGVDCIVFSGGTGENSPYIREKCMENLDYMGIVLDGDLNSKTIGKSGIISDINQSKVKIGVIPTNEELVVAGFTRQVVEKGRDLLPHEMQFQF
jgi:acetate kinase